MTPITVTLQTRVDVGRPNLTIADINILLPFTVTGIPEHLTHEQRDALSTMVCQALVPTRYSAPTGPLYNHPRTSLRILEE